MTTSKLQGAPSNMADTITLGTYIQSIMKERNISGRALSMYADVSQGALNNVLHDKADPDPKTLIKIADYLNIPVEELYRLAGYLPDEDSDLKDQLVREIEYLMKKLPDESRQRILEIVRVEHRLQTQDKEE